MTTEFKYGDRVVHSTRPEWGEGVITAAAADTVEGKSCQRLTVRFDRAGLKTLSTALASLRPAAPTDATPVVTNGETAARELTATGWLDRLGADAPEVIMSRLPENATDPFASPMQRLKASIEMYRFTPNGGSLLDWAAMQTGLADPLTIFNRHELEQFFARFATARDQHMRQLVEDIRRKDPQGLHRALAEAPQSVQTALRGRANGR